jgi:acyl dehydratase
MMGFRGRLAAPLLVAVAGFLACSDAVTGPNAVAAIDFTGIAFPAIVTGDTLRDGNGVATPLLATVYNGRGDVVPGAAVSYFTLDTGVAIDANGYLTATRRDGVVRLVASIDGLQSQQRTVQVTRRPDSVAAPTRTIAFDYRIPDAASNVSGALALTLQSRDTVGVGANVAGWQVRWRIVHNGDTLAVTDTTKVALWSSSGTRHSLTDTTKTDGASSRRLRVYANLIPVQVDSFIVVAEIKSRGVHVPGSPVRYVVTISPPAI